MVGKDDLTKPVRKATTVRAPKDPAQYTDQAEPRDPGNIEISTCSELTEHATPVNQFSSDGKIKCVQGFQGEPLVFAIGKGNRLNCIVHKSGAALGWTLYPISPSSDPIVAFDVSVIADADPAKNLKAGVIIVAATRNNQSVSQVFTTFVPGEHLGGTSTKDNTANSTDPWRSLVWTTVPDPQGGKDVSSVLIGTVTGRDPGQSATIIWAGTRQRAPLAATFYAVDLTSDRLDPWVSFAPATSADTVMDMQPASFFSDDGLFIFSSKCDRNEYDSYTVQPKTLEIGVYRGAMAGGVGRINSIYSSRNPWNGTDVVLAGEQGVGLVNFRTPSSRPIMVTGLPAIGFRHAVCSEKVNMRNESETIIVMFAVSNDNALYYIQGTRQWTVGDGLISLRASGLPIRQNVSNISCQFNSESNASEVVYTSSTGNDTIKHLIRDPVTTAWSETTIAFAAPKELHRYYAFVTTVSLRDSRGRPLGAAFPLGVKADAMHVVANDAVYRLNTATSTTIPTNSQGQVVLVAQASEDISPRSRLSLKTPTYIISVGEGHEEQVQGGQRVIEGLQKLDTPEKLAGAKSTTGDPIFEAGVLDRDKAQLSQSASLLKELPTLLGSVSGSPPQSGTGTDVTIEKGDAGKTHEDHGFLECVGDAIEWLRDKIKEGFKVVFTAVAKGVKFLLKVAGKVLSFVVETVKDLLSAIGDFLKETLGIDFKKFFKMLGLIFDPAATKANQDILKKMLGTALRLPAQIVRSNGHSIAELFDMIEMGLMPYLDDNTEHTNHTDPDDLIKDSPLSWVLDNPVMKIIRRLDPIAIIMEAAGESFEESGLGEDIQLPDVSSYLSPVAQTLWAAFKSILGQFIDLVKSLASDLATCATQPNKAMNVLKKAMQKAFRFLFNSIKTLVTTAWTVLAELLDAVVAFAEAKWKVPLVTTLFEWYAEQDFTILNLVTFVIARLLGIVVGDDHVASIIDPGPEFDKMSQVASNGNLFSESHRRLKSTMPIQPQGPEDSAVRVLSVDPAMLKTQHGGVLPMAAISSSASDLAANASLSRAEMKLGGGSTAMASSHTTTTGNGLSKAAQERIKTYEHWGTIINTAAALPRMWATVLKVMEIMGNKPKTTAKGPDLIAGVTIFTAGCSTVATALQVCNWQLAREHSDEVRKHLDHNFELICTGAVVGLVGNFAAVGFSSASALASYTFRDDAGAAMSKDVAALAGLAMTIGALGETIFMRIVPAARSDESKATSIIVSSVGMIGGVGGIVALIGGRVKDPDTTAGGLLVNGFCTFTATLVGGTLLIAST